jgi:transposase-like protein
MRKRLRGTVNLSGLCLGGAGVVGYLRWMTTLRDPYYAGYRYPAEIISYAVWLYFRFPLSLRMVEEMLAARGISVTYETIRQWGLKFGREFANRIRRRAPRRGDKWHLDEVVITIAGEKHWLWRAVDQEGFVLDVLVQSRRDKKAAKRLFRKLLKKQGRAPRVLITDKLKATPRPSVRSCPALNIGSIRASTTGRRIPTNRRDDESGS